jgi:group I intron endonuclease
VKVYLARNRANGKAYVGLTTKTVRERWALHAQQRHGSMAIAHAITKWGPGAFDLFLLEECLSEETLKRAEIKWIDRLSTFGSGGYNLTRGGDGLLGYRRTEDTKRRMSESHRDEKNHNFGKPWRTGPHREESKQKMRDRWKDHDHPTKGTRVPAERVERMRESQRKRVRKSTCVVQHDLDGRSIATHFSPQVAAAHVGGYSSKILSCCKGERKTSCGYSWSYANHVMWKRPDGTFQAKKE